MPFFKWNTSKDKELEIEAKKMADEAYKTCQGYFQWLEKRAREITNEHRNKNRR